MKSSSQHKQAENDFLKIERITNKQDRKIGQNLYRKKTVGKETRRTCSH